MNGFWLMGWLLSLAVFFALGFHLGVREVVNDYEDRARRAARRMRQS